MNLLKKLSSCLIVLLITGSLSIKDNTDAYRIDPESVIEGWINSSGHKANISSYAECGAGYYYSNSNTYGHYRVQNFR